MSLKSIVKVKTLKSSFKLELFNFNSTRIQYLNMLKSILFKYLNMKLNFNMRFGA